MDRNLSLSFGFKGQLNLNAQAVPLQEGYLKLGGFVSTNETNGLKFGIVVSAAPTTPDLFVAGVPSGNAIRGVCVFDDSIAQNAPAHPDKYLSGMPCAALNHGFMWLGSWTKAATGAIDPTLSCMVICNNTTGAIEFIPTGNDVPSGYTELENASVRSVDPDNGALIYLN